MKKIFIIFSLLNLGMATQVAHAQEADRFVGAQHVKFQTACHPEDVKHYDTIIFGGGIYASGINGLSFLKKNIDQLQGKNVIVFCDGASPWEETAFAQIVAHNLKDSLAGLPCFYCRGSWDPNGMSFVDRNLCKMLQKAVAKKKPEDWEVWEKALMEAGDQTHDWTDRSYIAPILEAIK